MKLNKDLVGKTIYGIATGNGARQHRGKSSAHIEKFVVSKVKRKYFDLKRAYNLNSEDYYDTDTYCPETGAVESQIRLGYGGNSGFIFFNTVEEAMLHTKKQSMLQEILSNTYKMKNLNYAQVEAVYNAMGFNEGQDNA